MKRFAQYKARRVEFDSLAISNSWTVKVYTITCHSSFASSMVLKNALERLPLWLAKTRELEFPTYGQAFLIVHEGRDGVWSLINWWIGGEMLRSSTFYTSFENPDEFKRFPEQGFMSCVWEMAVIGFERSMWIEHVLKKAAQPDFAGYMAQHLNAEV